MAARKGKTKDAHIAARSKKSAAAPEASVGGYSFKPLPIPEERIEDLAVFSHRERITLSNELQAEAQLVADALERVHQGEFEQATQQLKTISRSSPYADWRLFVRGLVAIYQSDQPSARSNWLRLDPARRPARIASALWRCETGQGLVESIAPPPAQLLEAATEIYQRRAIREAADKIAAITHRDHLTMFSASQGALLQKLRDRFQKVDAEFVQRFSHACLILTTHQPSRGAFDLLKTNVPGPVHDRRWNLLSYLYTARRGSEPANLAQLFEQYSQHDLPQSELAKGQRQAILSVLYRQRAEWARIDAMHERDRFPPWSEPPSYPIKEIKVWFERAIKAYPQYREAHHELIQELKHALSLTEKASEVKTLERQLWEAKHQLATLFPDEVATTLEVIDHLFDEERIQDARKLAGQLSQQRISDPLARALPWKLALLEMRQQGRRKDGIAAATQLLAEAEAHWPSWFPRDLLPYYRATLALRANDQSSYTTLIAEANAQTHKAPSTQVLLQFIAAQHLRVAPAEIKPIRTAVDQATASLSTLDRATHLEFVEVLWDLVRTGLQHSAYRLMAPKVGRPIAKAILEAQQKQQPLTVPRGVWGFLGKHRFFLANSYPPFPSTWIRAAEHDPFGIAALVEAIHAQRFSHLNIRPIVRLIGTMEEAARHEIDPFDRHLLDHYVQVARELERRVEAQKMQSRENFEIDLDDDDDDDDLDDDVFIDGDDSMSLDEIIASVPPPIHKIHLKLGAEGLEKLKAIMIGFQTNPSKEQFLASLRKLFSEYKISDLDYMVYSTFMGPVLELVDESMSDAIDDDDDHGHDAPKATHRAAPGPPAPHMKSSRTPSPKPQSPKQRS